MKPTIRVVLADDHTLVRAGILSLLTQIEGVQCIGEAANGLEAVGLVEKLQPDVTLMDIAMNGMNGLEATRRIRQIFPSARVLILSMHANEEYVMQAVRLGASGYLLKDAGRTELELALRAVAGGEIYLSPVVSRHLVFDYNRRLQDAATADPLESLTARQREILQLIAEGRTTQEIAYQLSISRKTVETHRTSIKERLDIHDFAGLVRFAVRHGVISPEP